VPTVISTVSPFVPGARLRVTPFVALSVFGEKRDEFDDYELFSGWECVIKEVDKHSNIVVNFDVCPVPARRSCRLDSEDEWTGESKIRGHVTCVGYFCTGCG